MSHFSTSQLTFIFLCTLYLSQASYVKREASDSQQSNKPDYDRDNGSCENCKEIDARTEAIKKEILRQLGLKEVPNVTKDSAMKTEKMYRLSERLDPQNPNEEDDLQDVSKSSINKVFSPLEKPPKSWNLGENSSLSVFNFDEEATVLQVGDAILWLYVKLNSTVGNLQHNLIKVEISQVVKVSSGDRSLVQLGSKIVDLRENDGVWTSFNVASAVSFWFKYPWRNYGLSLNAWTLDGVKLALDIDESIAQESFIEMKPAKKFLKRSKRGSDSMCQDSVNKTKCCLHPLTINFTKLGWDFITEPKVFVANYCQGECNPPYSETYTKLVKDDKQDKYSACCAPASLSSITMHYKNHEHGSSYMTTVKEVVAKNCKCF